MAAWGSGDLKAELDHSSSFRFPIEPDALIEISVQIFGRLAPRSSNDAPHHQRSASAPLVDEQGAQDKDHSIRAGPPFPHQ
jgi:hypothetical protein